MIVIVTSHSNQLSSSPTKTYPLDLIPSSRLHHLIFHKILVDIQYLRHDEIQCFQECAINLLPRKAHFIVDKLLELKRAQIIKCRVDGFVFEMFVEIMEVQRDLKTFDVVADRFARKGRWGGVMRAEREAGSTVERHNAGKAVAGSGVRKAMER